MEINKRDSMQYIVRNRRRLKRSTGANAPLTPTEARLESGQEIDRLDVIEIVRDATDASRR